VPRRTALPGTDRSPRLARAFLEETAGAHLGARRSDALLAISELATNALLYGSGPSPDGVIHVAIDAKPEVLRVAVQQTNSAADARMLSEPRPGVSEDGVPLGGFGLRLVDRLTDDWGVEPGPPGIVWFEVQGLEVPE
jgi:anti-sigma regulatory factor (Ser/Thr protein kinase)